MTLDESQTMSNASYYNNAGIAYLEQGKHVESLDMLKEAARLVMCVMANSCDIRNTRTDTVTDASMNVALDQANGVTGISRRFSGMRIADNNCFMFPVPIFLPADNAVSSNNCTEVSATILYNMALTYYINSKSSNPLPKALNNSMTLFDMACNLSLEIRHTPRSSQIIMSSLNNLGVLYRDQGNYKRSHKYFDDLSSYIASLREPTERSVARARQEFLLNALVLRNEAEGAAAA